MNKVRSKTNVASTTKVKQFLLLPLVPSFSSHLWLRYAPACLLPATALAPLLLLQTSNLPLCAHWAIRHLLCGRALGCSRSGRQQSGQGCAPGWHCSHYPSATCGEGTTPLRASAKGPVPQEAPPLAPRRPRMQTLAAQALLGLVSPCGFCFPGQGWTRGPLAEAAAAGWRGRKGAASHPQP